MSQPAPKPLEPVDALRRIAFLLERSRAETRRVEAYRRAAAIILPLGEEEVRRRVPDARLALVGEGPQYRELRARMDRSWITFTGYLSGADLAAAFASGDVFLFPSTTETLGFVALESFASGVPVVGARAGGVPFVIDDASTGFLVDPGAPDSAWAEPVARRLVDAPLRASMSRTAREEALRWSWRASTEKLVEVYRGVAGAS